MMRLLPGISVVLLLAGLSTARSAPPADPYQFGQSSRYSGCGSSSSEKAEFSWSRLRYRPRASNYGGFGYGYGGYGSWSRDYPKADRQFLLAMHRLTRIDGRTTEQVVDLDCNDAGSDIFNYPWVYAVQVESWTFTEAEAKRLREYLLKGGFLMVDDFHGTDDWEHFTERHAHGFPRPPHRGHYENKDEIFHVLLRHGRSLSRKCCQASNSVETGRT